MDRVILHCDLNNYFASVEIMNDPSLADKILVVGGDAKERKGVVLAKNDKAKAFGITTGEPIVKAFRKCSMITVVPPHMDNYIKYSKIVRKIYYEYTDKIEPFGIDECWLDVTGSQHLFGDGVKIANLIKEEVKEKTGLTISVGVSFNKIFAKLGSDMKKPDAITVLSRDNFKDKIFKLPVTDLLMVGRKTGDILKKFGINTIGELAECEIDFLESILGKNGHMLWKYANGLDNSSVEISTEPIKSISHNMTLPEDLINNEQVKKVFLEIAEVLSRKLRDEKFKCFGVCILIRDNDLKHYSIQHKLDNPTRNVDVVFKASLNLFIENYKWKRNIRSLGIKVYDLVDEEINEQISFFHSQERQEKSEILEQTIDNINKKYGDKSIKRALLIKEQKTDRKK